MKMKKLIAMLMVVGMAVAMLSACGGSKEEEAKKIESADDLEGADRRSDRNDRRHLYHR